MRNDPFLCFVIYMVIQERRMFLCMVVTCPRILKKHEFSPSCLERFVLILTFMILDLAIKSQKKQQHESPRSMNLNFLTFSQWRALFVETTLVLIQGIILLENSLSVLDEIYAERYSFMRISLFQ